MQIEERSTLDSEGKMHQEAFYIIQGF
jgi:hypothetical protein